MKYRVPSLVYDLKKVVAALQLIVADRVMTARFQATRYSRNQLVIPVDTHLVLMVLAIASIWEHSM